MSLILYVYISDIKIGLEASDKFSCLFKESLNHLSLKKNSQELFRKIINYYMLMVIICQYEQHYTNLFYTKPTLFCHFSQVRFQNFRYKNKTHIANIVWSLLPILHFEKELLPAHTMQKNTSYVGIFFNCVFLVST